ncbi:protein ERGIC-53-like [Mizuhopecten yessoensis]|uniref:protein ERGIC-53-like n=1 Tax=Mizuhopecten yessoensis TaxID=6573 RepID=UPI000B45EEAF|nr:protein ERGIC-53-like [Mizuhopecten yessoensis]
MLWTVALFSLMFTAECVNWKPRFEYKYSFKGPHLVQSDKSVPFWEYFGDSIASDENIRITPSLRSKKGQVWAKNPTTYDMWSVEMVFKVTGRGRVGADGMALWFTEQKGVEGPVFGSNDQWKGLGLFLDSFDNDGQHNNPYVMAMVNDGTMNYDHQSDGLQQQAGGCLRDFRNKPYPVRIKVEYYNNILTVFFNNGLTSNKDDFELCLRQENIHLPKSGYFGISAATGGLADDHDVLAFLTHSLIDTDKQPDMQQVPEQEKQKYEKEFDDYYQQLEKQKEEFQQQHPNRVNPDLDMPGMFESQGEQELKMIFDGQNEMHNTLKTLNRKLDELLGRQEMVLSKIGQLPSGQVQGGAPPQGGNQPQLGSTIQRHEVDKVLNNQNDIMLNAREIRNIINDVQQKASYIQNNVGTAQLGGTGGGTGGGIPADIDQIIRELQTNVRSVKSDTLGLMQRPTPTAGNCPPVESGCVSPFLFFVALGAQVIVLIGYMVYRQSRENQAKKFY